MQTHDFFTRLVALNCLGPNMQASRKDADCITAYECSSCGEEYDDEYEAKNCCRPQEIYRCSVCREKHDDEEDAISCHPGAGVNGQPMQCPICLTAAEDFEQAANCCLPLHPTMTAWGRIRTAEMVAAGTPWPEALAANANH